MDFPQKLRTLFSPRSLSYKDMVELLAQRRPARILVVDDNPDTMVLMRELLQIRGYERNLPTNWKVLSQCCAPWG